MSDREAKKWRMARRVLARCVLFATSLITIVTIACTTEESGDSSVSASVLQNEIENALHSGSGADDIEALFDRQYWYLTFDETASRYLGLIVIPAESANGPARQFILTIEVDDARLFRSVSVHESTPLIQLSPPTIVLVDSIRSRLESALPVRSSGSAIEAFFEAEGWKLERHADVHRYYGLVAVDDGLPLAEKRWISIEITMDNDGLLSGIDVWEQL